MSVAMLRVRGWGFWVTVAVCGTSVSSILFIGKYVIHSFHGVPYFSSVLEKSPWKAAMNSTHICLQPLHSMNHFVRSCDRSRLFLRLVAFETVY